MPIYTFAVGATFKNESHGIREWIQHYLYMGVEHFYLINDGSTDNTVEKIHDFIDAGIVEIFEGTAPSYIGRQRDMYNTHILPRVQAREMDWLLICDLDEYVWTPHFPSLLHLLQACTEAGQVQVAHTLFGSNGHETQPDGIVESFTRRSRDQPTSKGNLKYFVRSTYRFSSLNVHHATFENRDYQDAPHFILLGPEYLIMNHYGIQSREFWNTVKCTRGDLDAYRARTEEMFETENIGLNEVEDTRLLEIHRKIAEDLVAMKKEITTEN